MKLEDLKFEALKLSIDDRAELVQALDMSLEEDDAADAEHERLWKAEIERRCRALDEGRAELIPAEVVFRRARAALQ
ncbi:MAG TPA: addiction module antitoxin RelB [Acidobacteria bacterium]|nr:addiction module antitoxin RelB [Acidobacteriota bacterium]